MNNDNKNNKIENEEAFDTGEVYFDGTIKIDTSKTHKYPQITDIDKLCEMMGNMNLGEQADYRKYIKQQAETVSKAFQCFKKRIDGAFKPMLQPQLQQLQLMAQGIGQSFNELTNTATATFNALLETDFYYQLENLFTDVDGWIKEIKTKQSVVDMMLLLDLAENLEALRPYIEKYKAEHGNLSLSEFMHKETVSETGKPRKSIFEQLIDKAIARGNTLVEPANCKIKIEKADLFNRDWLPTIRKSGVMHDKITNTVFKHYPSEVLDISGQQSWDSDIIVGNNGKKKIITRVSLLYVGDLPVKKKLNPRFDIPVCEAVSSLYAQHTREHGIETPCYLTLVDIWRAMNGQQTVKNIKKEQLGRIKKSMEKMRLIDSYLCAKQEIEEKYISKDNEIITDGELREMFINCSWGYFRTNNSNVHEGYRIFDTPFLYKYCRLKGQLYLLPTEILDTSNKISNTDDVIAARRYLATRIAAYYEGDLDNETINYSAFYESGALERPEKKIDRSRYKNEHSYKTAVGRRAKKNIETVLKLLKYWAETPVTWINKINKKAKPRPWIKGFEAKKNSVTIKYDDEQRIKKAQQKKIAQKSTTNKKKN